MIIEVQISLLLYGDKCRDSYEFIYCYFRFPVWWLIGFIEIIIINIIFKIKKKILEKINSK